MKLTATALAVAVTAATPALAQDVPPGQPAPPPAAAISKLDVRLTAASTSLLFYVGLGINADYSALQLGPLTFTLGGQLDWDVCFLTCVAKGTVSGQTIVDRLLTPKARITVHFPPVNSGQAPLDLYLMGNAGLVIANHSATDVNGAFAWHATAYGPALSGGVGASFLWANFFFTGVEIPLQYLSYRYTPAFTIGSTTVPDADLTGGGFDLQLRVFLGLRF